MGKSQVSLIDSACLQYPANFLIDIYPKPMNLYEAMSCNFSDRFYVMSCGKFYFCFIVTNKCILTLTDFDINVIRVRNNTVQENRISTGGNILYSYCIIISYFDKSSFEVRIQL